MMPKHKYCCLNQASNSPWPVRCKANSHHLVNSSLIHYTVAACFKFKKVAPSFVIPVFSGTIKGDNADNQGCTVHFTSRDYRLQRVYFGVKTPLKIFDERDHSALSKQKNNEDIVSVQAFFYYYYFTDGTYITPPEKYFWLCHCFMPCPLADPSHEQSSEAGETFSTNGFQVRLSLGSLSGQVDTPLVQQRCRKLALPQFPRMSFQLHTVPYSGFS